MTEVRDAAASYDRYTYSDYSNWAGDERWELIEGIPFSMAAPSQAHQEISGHLHHQIYSYLIGKSCKVFSAPFDVRLNADTEDDTVVQPDLLVVCDRSKLDGKACIGAPDLVVEILSSSTAFRDLVTKFRLYLRAGVREYWIVNPESKSVTVHILKNGEYVASAYGSEDELPVHVLDGCVLSLIEVFPLEQDG